MNNTEKQITTVIVIGLGIFLAVLLVMTGCSTPEEQLNPCSPGYHINNNGVCIKDGGDIERGA